MKLVNKKTRIAIYQTVISALEDYPGRSFPLGGKVWKSSDLVAAFQAAIDAINGNAADKITWEASVAKEKAAEALAQSLFSGLKGYIAVADGRKSNAFKTFGFAPAPAAPSPETKVAANAKIRATRKARGTLGKAQRARITGVIAPVTAGNASGVVVVGGGNGNGSGNGNGNGNGNGTGSGTGTGNGNGAAH